MTGLLTYVVGDATHPTGDGQKIITHVCNDIGAWGAGFVKALSRRWDEPEDEYRAWYTAKEMDGMPFCLGQVQFVAVSPDITVANMIAQEGVGRHKVPLRYAALGDCLNAVTNEAVATASTVHMPRIGCGLAGGSWAAVLAVIEDTLLDAGIDVIVYDLPPR